jgi:hypothetical protein
MHSHHQRGRSTAAKYKHTLRPGETAKLAAERLLKTRAGVLTPFLAERIKYPPLKF